MLEAKRLSLIVVIFLLVPFTLRPVVAAEERADVRILIDVSGSMKKNDPKNLRRPALRLLVGLLPPSTRAGVWTFGQYVNMQIPLGQVDQSWKMKARKSSKSIGSPGQYTNIEDALKRSTEDWEGPPLGYRRSVILLTDGMVDISKDKSRNAASRNRIMQTILPKLQARNAVIHTIALSKNADHELMRELAETTGGWYEQVENADQLQKVFLRIFEKVGKPDAVPLKDNKFTIDDSITEATVLVFHKPDAEPTEVIKPDGTKFSAGNPPTNVEWHRDQGYDMLTISNPASGEWRIRAETDPDNRVMVVTDLKMKTTDLPNRLIHGQVLPFEASFTDHGKVIRKQEFLNVIEVSSIQSDLMGEHEPRPLLDNGGDEDADANDGQFSMSFGGESLNTGLGELVIHAKGRTFVREKRMTYEVVPPLTLEASPDEGGQQLTLDLKADATLIDPQSLQIEAWLEESSGEQVEIPLRAAGPGEYRTEINLMDFNGPRKISLKASANTLSGEMLTYLDAPMEVEGIGVAAPPKPVIEPEPLPDPTPEPASPPASDPAPETEAEDEEEGGWVGAAVWFGAINLLIILVGGGAFWWIRMRNQRNMVSLVEESVESEKAVQEESGNG